MGIPKPHVGLVFNYEYLWKTEGESGLEEGSKSRPSCIVACNENLDDGNTVVFVLPITHSPQNEEEALKIPPDVKNYIGLDDENQWVVCSEMNKFIWPSCDIRPISKNKPNEYSYGTITIGFLNAIKTKMKTLKEGKKFTVVQRTA